MNEIRFNCEECGSLQVVDEVPRRGSICFRCHIRSVGIGFSYGRETFHGPTIREQQTEIMQKSKITGVQPEFVGSRWV